MLFLVGDIALAITHLIKIEDLAVDLWSWVGVACASCQVAEHSIKVRRPQQCFADVRRHGASRRRAKEIDIVVHIESARGKCQARGRQARAAQQAVLAVKGHQRRQADRGASGMVCLRRVFRGDRGDKGPVAGQGQDL